MDSLAAIFLGCLCGAAGSKLGIRHLDRWEEREGPGPAWLRWAVPQMIGLTLWLALFDGISLLAHWWHS